LKKTRLYLTGGLGNQLFQLRFAQGLERKGLEVTLDTSALAPRSLELPMELINFVVTQRRHSRSRTFQSLAHKNLLPTVIFEDRPNVFHKSIFNLIQLNHFGYYQSINQDISFPLQLGNFEEMLFDKHDFAVELSQSLAIHIRGGDFKGSEIYLNLGVDYYVGNIKRVNLENSRHIFVFTDDPEYSQSLIDEIGLEFDLSRQKIVFINQEISPFETLKLLSIAKTRIISNSTFSWWGGILALNRGRNNTFAPSTFFREKQMTIPLPSTWDIQIV